MIYNRLHVRMPLGIDATLRYGLDIPPTRVDPRVAAPKHLAVQHAQSYLGLPPTPIANPGLASMQAAAHPANVNYLYFVRKPDKKHHFFTASFKAFQDYANAHGYGPGAGDRRLVGLLGDPVSALALAASCRTPPSRRAGSTGRTSRCGVGADDLEDALRGLIALGFAGANVTTPHKLAVARLVESRGRVREHARRPQRRAARDVHGCRDPCRAGVRARRDHRRRRRGDGVRSGASERRSASSAARRVAA